MTNPSVQSATAYKTCPTNLKSNPQKTESREHTCNHEEEACIKGGFKIPIIEDIHVMPLV